MAVTSVCSTDCLESITPAQQETINTINNMSHFEMCSLWRSAPAGHPYFDTLQPFAKAFQARLFGHFGGFNPEISKRIG